MKEWRITPAHAGKTGKKWAVRGEGKDHPRACGENAPHTESCCPRIGSPPRMRGKQNRYEYSRHTWRITPAHAGKTTLALPFSLPATDHPRACGENTMESMQRLPKGGSPPRVRGKRLIASVLPPQPRITPARAGKTLRKWRISVVDPSPQPRSSLTSRRADASIGSQRAPCAAPV